MPSVVSWPGRIGRKKVEEVTASLDVFNTLLSLREGFKNSSSID